MKLYTEEQVRKAMQESRYAFSTEKGYDEILNSLTPIELPSDEEIIKKANQEPNNLEITEGNRIGYIAGAKWVIKKILNQNK